MKRLILLLAIGFTAISAFAVTHANSWTMYDYGNNGGTEYNDFRHASISKDTIIDDVTYYVLNGYLFRYNEESNRIYCRLTDDIMKWAIDSANIQAHKEGADILFLDYNANVGDTVYTMALPEGWIRKNIVKSVTENDGRRWINVEFNVFEYPGIESDVYANDYWIEGVGSKAGLFCYSLRWTGIYGGEYIFCASHDDDLLYRESEEKAKSIYKEYGIISPCHEDVIDAVENVAVEESATKIFRDGQVLILRGGIIYNTLGQEIK